MRQHRGALEERHRFGKVSEERGRQIASIDRARDDEHNTASLDSKDFVAESEENHKLMDPKAIDLLTSVLLTHQLTILDSDASHLNDPDQFVYAVQFRFGCAPLSDVVRTDFGSCLVQPFAGFHPC